MLCNLTVLTSRPIPPNRKVRSCLAFTAFVIIQNPRNHSTYSLNSELEYTLGTKGKLEQQATQLSHKLQICLETSARGLMWAISFLIFSTSRQLLSILQSPPRLASRRTM